MLDAGERRAKSWRWRWFGRARQPEADCLTGQIAEKARAENAYPDVDLDCFLAHRFHEPLLKYGASGPLYGRAFTVLSVSVVAAGFASSAISANSSTAEDWRWVLIVLGLLVALFTAVNQLWKPGMRSVGNYRAGNALRREGWDYVFDRGRYEERKEGFHLFLDAIKEIQSQVDAIDEVQVEVGNGTDSGPSGTAKESRETGPPPGGAGNENPPERRR